MSLFICTILMTITTIRCTTSSQRKALAISPSRLANKTQVLFILKFRLIKHLKLSSSKIFTAISSSVWILVTKYRLRKSLLQSMGLEWFLIIVLHISLTKYHSEKLHCNLWDWNDFLIIFLHVYLPNKILIQKSFTAIYGIGMIAGLIAIPQLATWELRLVLTFRKRNRINKHWEKEQML